MTIGNKINELRKQKGFTLHQLSKASGVQIATISRIENGKMTGSLDSHMAIAKSLGVDITELYSAISGNNREDSRVELQEKEAAKEVFVHNDKATYEVLTGNLLKRKMMPALLKLEPGGQTAKETNRPGSEKFVFALNAPLDVTIGNKHFTLKQGHSLYFDSNQEHFFSNNTTRSVQAIVVLTPVEL